MRLAAYLTLACLACVAGLVAAEHRERRAAAAACKLGASLLFIALALALGALDTAFGRLMALGLVLSAVGDAFLLSRRDAAFMAGLGAFLLAHLAYSAAFAGGALDRGALAWGAAAIVVVGGLSLRWLWTHLAGAFRPAVAVYVAAIGLMCSLAIGFGVAEGDWRPALGAVLFAASDLSVARDAFVARAVLNKVWGLPIYYAAQLLMAWSVAPWP